MIADQLKRIRKEKRMSQRDVAEKMGVSQQFYQQYEGGTRRPKMSTIRRFAEAMGVDATAFLDDAILASMELSPEDESESLKERLNDVLADESEQRKIDRLKDYATQLSILQYAHANYTGAADRLMELYESLNADGKKEAIKRIEELSQLAKYQDE